MTKKRVTCLGLMLLLLWTLLPRGSSAEAPQGKVVRVGYVNAVTYEEGLEDEYKTGSGYEYLQKIASVTGWTYEYVYGSFKECYDMLVNGEIDLFGDLTYTAERARLFNFSMYPQGKETYYIYTNDAHPELDQGSVEPMNGCRIGVTMNSYQLELLQDWVTMNGVQVDIVQFSGYAAMLDALASDDIQALVAMDLSIPYGCIPLVEIGSSEFYFGVSRQRPDLLRELSKALHTIQSDEFDYNGQLVRKYHNTTLSSMQLTDAEQQWLDERDRVLRIGLLDGNMPYSDRTAEGTVTGLIPALAETMQQALDITVEMHCYESTEALQTALLQGSVDIIGPVYGDLYLAEQQDYVLTNQLLPITPVALYATDEVDLDHIVVAVCNETLISEHVTHVLFPSVETYLCATMEECLDAVVSGKANCTFVSSARLNALRVYPSMAKLQFVDLPIQADVCLATTKANRLAAMVVNRGLALSTDTLNGTVLAENTYVAPRTTLREFVRDNLSLVLTSAGVVIFVLAVMAFLLYRNGRRLDAALDTAQRASMAKTVFLSNMSHDIRTPMNAIIGFTNIALNQQPKEGVRECLEKIHESSAHLLGLINDVLDISRIESGKVTLQPVPVDITEVTNVVVDMANGYLSTRRLTLTVNRQKPENPYVLADAVRIREILVNILSNAVKFTPDGGTITMDVRFRPGEDPDYIVACYRIADTGIGMSSEFLTHVFDEFAQENVDARTKYKGTGLGMAITKHYVDLMGGTIHVESKRGAGTTFSVELPLEQLDKGKAADEGIAPIQRDLSQVNILLVEDNDLNAEIAMVQLEQCGLQITRAVDGEDAVAQFRDHAAGTFSLILMDIMMPGMNGYEATQAIRTMKNRPDGRRIPIIAMTANAFAEDVQASLDAGMNDHLSKPIVLDEVVRAISRHLGR